MQIILNGHEYAFQMNGTVGYVYAAQRMLPDGEDLDLKKHYHRALLFYAILLMSNKEAPSLDLFLGCLTSQLMNEMAEYVDERWEQLEGPSAAQGDDGSKKKD